MGEDTLVYQQTMASQIAQVTEKVRFKSAQILLVAHLFIQEHDPEEVGKQ